ncbi:MAG: ABC-2 type transport system ATP-binding protein [Planctomycetota bacterium]|jgi:ABC-2 type transport system ATP-binding protein
MSEQRGFAKLGAQDSAGSMAQDSAVTVRGLFKRYGDLVAVDGLDLDLPRGACLGLLGPNGAGKTTTVEILEGLKPADAGDVQLLGMTWDRDAAAIRESIGVQLQETNHIDKLTCLEVLRLFRSFYATGDEPAHVLEAVELTEKRDARVVALSGGQKQRLALGCALVNRPRLLFLDEPTTGLDPQARRRVWEIIEEFKLQGGSVLLTTHYMEEAERLADELLVIDRGSAIARGTPAELIASLKAEGVIEMVFGSADDAVRGETALVAAADADSLGAISRHGALLRFTVIHVQEALQVVLTALSEAGLRCDDLRTHRPTLEDVFVHLTGKHLREN